MINFHESELNIMKKVMLKLSKNRVSIFRNNVGTGWIGRVFRVAKPVKVFINNNPVQLNAGDIVIQEPRPLDAGLFKGSSDLIGWKTITIEPEMVGKQIAVFSSIEVKKHNGKATKEQVLWIQNIRNAGGIGGVARSEDDADLILNNYLESLRK
jgi:hypothetical protein